MADRTRLKNRIHSVLAGLLVPSPEGGLFTAAGLAWLRSLGLPQDARSTVDRFLRLHDAVEAELESLDAELRALAHHDDRVRLLMTLPGVAHGVALTLVAALGDTGRFRDGDHAAVYLGLVPTVRQSAAKADVLERRPRSIPPGLAAVAIVGLVAAEVPVGQLGSIACGGLDVRRAEVASELSFVAVRVTSPSWSWSSNSSTRWARLRIGLPFAVAPADPWRERLGRGLDVSIQEPTEPLGVAHGVFVLLRRAGYADRPVAPHRLGRALGHRHDVIPTEDPCGRPPSHAM